MTQTTRNCPACASSASAETILQRRNVPVLQNVIVPSESEARAFPTHDLHYVMCPSCGFVWNQAFDDSKIDYSGNYNNSVQSSAFYLQHQRAMARNVLASLPADRTGYVEVGCGAGEFIENLLDVADGKIGAVTGFDPAWTGQRDFDERVTIHAKYFSLDDLGLLPRGIGAIASRHTIEHIPSPRAFVEILADACRAEKVDLFPETPDVAWILENTAFEDWFYEHCSLFSPASIDGLLADFGMTAKTEAVYAGQYMWTHATAGDAQRSTDGVQRLLDLAGRYRRESSALLERWREDLSARRRAGPVAVWGAASKGVTFSLLMNRDEPLVDFGVDLNPAKQGCYMPVTGTPIVSPEDARAAGVATLIVMNPNYHGEITGQVAAMGWDAEVLNLRPG